MALKIPHVGVDMRYAESTLFVILINSDQQAILDIFYSSHLRRARLHGLSC